MHRLTLIACAALLLGGCDSSDQASADGGTALASTQAPAGSAAPAPRWYSAAQVRQGMAIYGRHCAECHGPAAQGASDWRQPGPDGRYPAPPLNGSGHAWHHPLGMLRYVIRNGSPGGQGNMPAWGGKLDEEEILAVIAWFQSRWPEQAYANWSQIDARARSRRAEGDQGGR
ncbi:c-type cytochrome [Thioalbus denitrificans]|uniref:Cbb3-type cytochrome c oxidase subunit III n=1 Tax=Thioalbus denitrificans TaxID=547122 RepID=A0A369BYI3_9GAMM|nr:cytochrome c [Thioalbus denitrificans]RCX26381.1 cbb3-type cytochrome c oxidase subunit III [Thioalbus denitrificans]